MDIKLLVGRLVLPEWTTLKEFFAYLQSHSGEALDDEDSRRLYVRSGPELTVGLNLYVSDSKKFYKLEHGEDGGDQMRVVEVDDHTHFNYFYFRNDTGAYVFSHYKGCFTGIERFHRLLRDRFRAYIRDSESQIQERRKQRKSRRARGDSVHPQFLRVYTKESWIEHLDRLNSIEELRLGHTYEIVDLDDQTGLPESGVLKSKTEICRFTSTSLRKSIIDYVQQTVAKLMPSRASVSGIDSEGNDVTIKMGRNVEVFDRFDHDTVVHDINLDRFDESAIMRLMLDYKDHAILSRTAK